MIIIEFKISLHPIYIYIYVILLIENIKKKYFITLFLLGLFIYLSCQWVGRYTYW